MPQELQVLRCYNCETFQVHIVKKSPKWECKICGEKQSIKKVYGRGPGKDCRILVQELNQKRLENSFEPTVNETGFYSSPTNTCRDQTSNMDTKSNRWAEFLDLHQKHLANNIEPPVSETGYEFYSSPTNSCKDQISNMDAKPNRWAEFMCSATTIDSDIQTENDEFSSYTFERPIKRSKHRLSNKKHLAEDPQESKTRSVNASSNLLLDMNQGQKCTTIVIENENDKIRSKSVKKRVYSELLGKTTAINQKLDKKVDPENSHLACSDNLNSTSFAQTKNSKWAQFIPRSFTSENKIDFQDIDLNTTELNGIPNTLHKCRSNDFCLQPSSNKSNDEFGSEGRLMQNKMLTNALPRHSEGTSSASSSCELDLQKPLDVFLTAENDLDSILTF